MCKTQQIDLTIFLGIYSIKIASLGGHATAEVPGSYLAVTTGSFAAPEGHDKERSFNYYSLPAEIALLGICDAH